MKFICKMLLVATPCLMFVGCGGGPDPAKNPDFNAASKADPTAAKMGNVPLAPPGN